MTKNVFLNSIYVFFICRICDVETEVNIGVTKSVGTKYVESFLN